MCNANQDTLIEELQIKNRQLLYTIAKLEQAKNYYPGFPAPGQGQKEIDE